MMRHHNDVAAYGDRIACQQRGLVLGLELGILGGDAVLDSPLAVQPISLIHGHELRTGLVVLLTGELAL